MTENTQVGVDVGLFGFGLVLHDKPGMFQRNDLAKEPVHFVDAVEKFEIFASAKTKTTFAFHTEVDLGLNALQNKRQDCGCE